MDPNTKVFPPYRLVAEYGDGSRLLFDGLTEQQAMDALEAAQAQHGDIVWYDCVTDQHYERGVYHALAPQPPVIDILDFTELIIPDDNEEE